MTDVEFKKFIVGVAAMDGVIQDFARKKTGAPEDAPVTRDFEWPFFYTA